MAKYTCPDCGGKLKVWFDINASIEFDISATGRITKPTAESSDTGEERAGIKCRECEWEVHLSEAESDGFSEIFERAGAEASEFELIAKRIKK